MRTIGLAVLCIVAATAQAFAGEQQAGEQNAQQACPSATKPSTQTATPGNEVAQDPNKRGVLNVGQTGAELRDPNKRGVLNTAQLANCNPPADPPKR